MECNFERVYRSTRYEIFPRKLNRASGRELHFYLDKEDDARYMEPGAEVAILIKAYLKSSKKERAIFQSVANHILKT